jgi:hypothetical protein
MAIVEEATAPQAAAMGPDDLMHNRFVRAVFSFHAGGVSVRARLSAERLCLDNGVSGETIRGGWRPASGRVGIIWATVSQPPPQAGGNGNSLQSGKVISPGKQKGKNEITAPRPAPRR